jgi:NTE family protein
MPQYEFGRKIKRPVAYVFAGGASYGSIQAGMLRALADSDITPDMVLGTSVGSLNGAVVAEDPDNAADKLTALWSVVTRDQIFGGVVSAALNLASGRPSAVGNEGLRAFVEGALVSRDFADLAIPHTAMATDFDTGLPVSIREGDLISALLASAAIPTIFPSVAREGMRLVDGGLVANVPIGQAVAQGAKTIVVLDCGFTVLAPDSEDTFSGRLLRMAAIMAAQQVRRDLDKTEGRRVLYLPGPWPAAVMPDDFSHSVELADRAEVLAREWLAELEITGPGRYGYAPSDALTDHRENLSDAARQLAEEAGVIPVDEDKIAEHAAARETEAARDKAGKAAKKAGQ